MELRESLTLVLVIPWAGALLIPLLGRWPNLRETVSVLTSLLLLGAVTVLYGHVDSRAAAETVCTLLTILPGIDISFRLEPLAMLFVSIASVLWVVNTIYSIGYMRGNNEGHQTRFYLCFAIAIGATMGLALSANLLTLFVFYEILTLSTYPLVTHKGSMKAATAGRTYLGYLLGTSIAFFLTAIVWTWTLTGTLEFRPEGLFKKDVDASGLSLLFLLYIFGIGKAAIMPVHRWLPAAMIAPTPVSALLHAVAVVKAGVFTITKVILYVFGPALTRDIPASEWIVYLAGTTIVLASWIALRQHNLKRRLAYSTISQLSYVIMAAALGTAWALLAAALHIAVHAFGKITLFFAAGSVYTASGKTEIPQLRGIGRQMPWTMCAFTVGAVSMVGLPPAAGFLSKWYLLMGAMQLQDYFVLAVVVISTLLNAAYFFPIIHAAFFLPAEDDKEIREAPWPVVVALSLTAVLTVALFLYPKPVLSLAALVSGAGP